MSSVRSKSEGFESIQVLIVDDDPMLRDYLANTLREFKIESIFHAGSINRAMELLLIHPIDIVFLDIQLKGENGLTALSDMTKVSETTKFVMLSAHSSMENARKAISLGAKGFVVKPFTARKIEDILEVLTGLSHKSN